MQIDHKNVFATETKVLSSEDGIVRTYVSVTGIVDNVKDVIEPGAYTKTLADRTPKGVWHHNWHEPIAKTLSIKELMPGDPSLPKTLPNGLAWPAEAGALLVETQFNLKTQRGSDAFADVEFFGDDQEWSIGYNVPVGGSHTDSKSGIRYIKALDLYEYSPVLFGAMPAARTATLTAVKDLMDAMPDEETEAFLVEMKSLLGDDFLDEIKAGKKKKKPKNTDQDPDDEEGTDPDDDLDDPDWEGKADDMEFGPEQIRAMYNAHLWLKSVFEQMDTKALDMFEGEAETKEPNIAELAAKVDGSSLDDYAEFVTAAKSADAAASEGDIDALDEAAVLMVKQIEDYVAEYGDPTPEMQELAGALQKALASIPDDDSNGDDGGDDAAESKDLFDDEMNLLFKDYDVDYQIKRAFTPKAREDAAAAGDAMPDGSFPIKNEDDLKNAIKAYGRAKDKPAAMAWIKSCAAKMGLEDLLPDEWQSEKALAGDVETKDLLAKMQGLGVNLTSVAN